VSADDGGLRRVLPPTLHRAGPVAVLVRWRVEVLLCCGVTALWHYGGIVAMGLLGAALATLVALAVVEPGIRAVLVTASQMVLVPHRVRSGLAQAGVTDRRGRLPWILLARPSGPALLVHLWLRSGTTIGDLRDAAPLISTACGAAHVEIQQLSPRNDRARLYILRPRWGLLGK
jgi:hypothetical protein